MRALRWHGKHDIRCDTVPDPIIEEGRDAIIKVSTCAICGSDLHLFDGFMPTMESGDIMGHEFMGEVVEVGKDNKALSVGDRVVIPFTIFCGECDQCKRGNFSVCERSNRNKEKADKVFGHATAGLFGYSHLTGGYAGGQAEYVRVPMADTTHVKIPDGLTDEQVLFLGDIFPTGPAPHMATVSSGWMSQFTAACQPVGQMAIRSAVLLGARQVVVIDRVPERLVMARAGGAITINFDEESVLDRLKELTNGKGPEKCIDAVGMESHATRSFDAMYDRVKQAVMLETDRPHVLREMIYVCRPAGILSVPGVYGGLIDKIPFGAAMNKGLTWKMGQTHVNRWTDDLLHRIQEGQIDPSFVTRYV
jgi:threonine dehydrogenase-like Zn-dependent dehydrogenase